MENRIVRKFKTNAGILDAITGIDENSHSVVLIVHGMMEYKERYRDFWEFLIKNGYGYATFDLPAHGASVAEGKDIGEWPENGFQTSVDAIREITGFLKDEYKKDIYIFGHSLGSFITLGAISDFGNEFKGCALSGSGDKQPAALLGSGKGPQIQAAAQPDVRKLQQKGEGQKNGIRLVVFRRVESG
jgi:alpha-beta hydrolase superfamily lysophospholipase